MGNYRIIAFDPYGYEKTYFVEAESYAEAEKMVNRMRNNEMPERYEVGEYIIYQNGEKYEIGRITKLQDDGAFVCYHEGETAAKTPYECMHKLENQYVMTLLGGDRFADVRCAECKHQGQWENEYEMGYPSPCTECRRRARDNYERME